MAATVTPRRSFLDRAASFSWRFLLVVAGLVVLGIIASRLSFVLVPLLVALLLAVVLRPLADWLERRGLPRTGAAALVFLALVVLLVGLIVLLAPGFVTQFADLDDALSEGLASIRDWLIHGPLALSQARVQEVFDLVSGQVSANGLRSGIITSASIALQVVAGTALAIVLAFFFVKDGRDLWSWIVRMVPEEARDHVDAAGGRAWRVLGGYLLGGAVQGAIEALMIGAALLVLGVPLVLPLMLLTFLAAFFPLVGAVTAGIIAVLVALVSGGWVDALLVAAVVVLVQQLESNVLAPLVLGRAVRLHPVVILVVLTVGGVLGGVLGAFVAVPVTAVVWGVVKELVQREVIEPPGDVEPLLEDEGDAAA
jgi:predicted PurR-regulated permease PerM